MAPASEQSPAKKRFKHSAARTPLRKASEMPSPTNGSTNAAASPTCRTNSLTGSGSWKTRGEVVTGAVTGFHFRLRSYNAGWQLRTASIEVATADRIIAQALIRD